MRNDWTKVELGAVCDIRNGKNQKQVVDPSGKYPIYGSAGIMSYANDYLCDEGTTIVGRKGTINNPIYVKTKFWNVDTAFGLSPNKNVLESKFLFFFCRSFNFHKLDRSTTIPSLAKSDLLKISFFLAPLPIQRAILSKIEQLFSELDNGIQNLQQAKEKLAVFRQAVLKKAFEGELTNAEMENKKLSEVCEIIMGQSPSGTSYNKLGNGTPLINGPVEFGLGPLGKTVKSKWTTEPKKMCKKNDLILCVRGSTTGKTNIADFDACVGRGVAAIRYSENQSYLNHYMLFKRQEIFTKGTGSTFPSVSSDEIKNFIFPVCSIQEQHQIVQEIESRLSVCDEMEKSIQSSLKKAEALRQSILKKAFEGELLTEKEIDQCKQEPDWETAEELLERIEKENNKTKE